MYFKLYNSYNMGVTVAIMAMPNRCSHTVVDEGITKVWVAMETNKLVTIHPKQTIKVDVCGERLFLLFLLRIDKLSHL